VVIEGEEARFVGADEPHPLVNAKPDIAEGLADDGTSS
jgi:hypothetical protein